MSAEAGAEPLRAATELRHWALGVGDEDVVLVCNRALAGDNTALEEVLEWHDVWSATHRASADAGVR